MESRLDTSHGTSVPKKSRSLDLKSLQRGKVLKDVENKKLKRKASEDEGNENSYKKKKKSKKEVSLSRLKDISSNGKKCIDSVFPSRLSSSGLHDSKDMNGSIGFYSISSLDNVIQIPRRKRGFVGRKKFRSGQVSKQEGHFASKLDQVEKSIDSGRQVEPWKVKRKHCFHDFKGNTSSKLNSVSHALEEDERVNHSVNGDLSIKKSRRNQPGTTKFAPDSEDLVEAEIISDKPFIIHSTTQEDEENLEENAAMMLSSRFNPNCTRYTSNNKATALTSVEELSFCLSSHHVFVRSSLKSISGSESLSNDTAGRVLRPRKQHKEKGHSRKRRHYYEIFFRDLDAYWVLNRRIKVFWPLDQSWYYGLVNDYDGERKLHHVKYDDRDEEWINLKNERFKLLLLPGEVPGKAERRKSTGRDQSSDQRKRNLKSCFDKDKGDLPMQADSYIGSSYMDSEPIISWLARSTRHVKSPFPAFKKQKTSDSAFKKQKTSDLSMMPVLPLFSKDSDSLHGSFESCNMRRDKKSIPQSSNLTSVHADDAMEDSASECITCPQNRKLPIVYCRRRFRKTGLEIASRLDDNHLCRSAYAPVTSFGPVDEIGDFEKQDVFVGRLDHGGKLSSVDDVGVLKFMWSDIESGKVKFNLDIPLAPILYHSLGVDNFWLFHDAILLHHGAVMIAWPQVHLEMLLVDNIVGLRFLLFEGCLKQALAFVFLVLDTFCQPIKRKKFVELQLPATSISFKLTCCQCLNKQLVFAFYNFLEMENSKWMYLDWKLKRLCSLNKHLPLSECTYDNIQMLQSRANHSSLLKVKGRSTLKGAQKRSRQGISLMGFTRESTFMDTIPNSDEICQKLPPFALSFTAAHTSFLNLHRKMVTEHSPALLSLWEHDAIENLENFDGMMMADSSCMVECLNKFVLQDNPKAQLSSGPSVSVTGDWSKSSQPCYNGDDNLAESFQPQACQSHHLVSGQCVLSSRTLYGKDESETVSQSFLNDLSIKIPSFNQLEKSHIGIFAGPSPSPTAPISSLHQHKQIASFGYPSLGWSDEKADTVCNSFGNGPRKPRTQVSYSLPFGVSKCTPKQKSIQKSIPSKQTRKANRKRPTNVSKGSQINLELFCEVNILITVGDRGWRVSGARVMLELFGHNEWKLAVKMSGITKYTYKAHQFLQPGSTNRYTHAMMWKGGKDWILEFQDRSQWTLFKEMHEECYNQNIQAALRKNIPIPGVRLIEEGDYNGTEILFPRSSKYSRQVETDVEMALNPTRFLYDMDSDDERWILNYQKSVESDGCSSGKISEEVFEKIMDMFEKASYSQQQDLLTLDEIGELMSGVGPVDVIKAIYEHWWLKRKRNGMPLIRQLQPPMWERYQGEVREWELAVTKINSNLPSLCQDTVEIIEKPPMFAFCMKPRGLEVPNKGSKQRSQKKLSVAGQSNATYGYQDGFLACGKRLNGFLCGDGKFVYIRQNYDYLEDSLLPQKSSHIYSPQDAVSMPMIINGRDRNIFDKTHRRTSKLRSIVPPNESQTMTLCDHRIVGNKHGIHGSMGYPASPQHYYPVRSKRSKRHIIEQFDGPDLDEFRLRDASGAALHAINMAKLKRERAERMVYRADLAIHKAVAALMTAEAMEECSETSYDKGSTQENFPILPAFHSAAWENCA